MELVWLTILCPNTFFLLKYILGYSNVPGLAGLGYKRICISFEGGYGNPENALGTCNHLT